MIGKTFGGRPVTAVLHDDESTPHTHFLVPWKDELGRSARVSIGGFRKMNHAAAKILGRTVTKEGQGKRDQIKTKEFLAHPEAAITKIRKQEEQIRSQKEAVKKILEIYGEIKVAAIGPKGRFEICKASEPDQINLRRLRILNGNGEGIYFKPTKDNNIVFLDDVPYAWAYNPPFAGTTIIETSPGRYQAHIPLHMPKKGDICSEKMKSYIQKLLAATEEADHGSTDAFHHRRLPGFENQKYPEHPLVDILPPEQPERPRSNLVYAELTHKARLAEAEIKKAKARLASIQRIGDGDVKKKWWDFEAEKTAQGIKDLSRVDISYTLYLLARGVSDNEIRDRLISESLHINVRKKGHLDDYLNRTITKAERYLYENTPAV